METTLAPGILTGPALTSTNESDAFLTSVTCYPNLTLKSHILVYLRSLPLIET